jgi:hypothetical protein
MFNPDKAKSSPPPPTYAWDEHPEALLGVIYLYFSSNCNPAEISDERMQAFVDLHQDAQGTLTDKQVITAVQAVRGMDGRSGPRPGKTLIALWDALSPLRERLPVYAYREPVAVKKAAADEPPDVAALLAAFIQGD